MCGGEEIKQFEAGLRWWCRWALSSPPPQEHIKCTLMFRAGPPEKQFRAHWTPVQQARKTANKRLGNHRSSLEAEGTIQNSSNRQAPMFTFLRHVDSRREIHLGSKANL